MYNVGWRAGSVVAMAEDGVWLQAPTQWLTTTRLQADALFLTRWAPASMFTYLHSFFSKINKYFKI